MRTKITDMDKIRASDSLLLTRAKELILLHRLGSIQMLQRHFGIGYMKASAVFAKLKKNKQIQEVLKSIPEV